MRFVLGVQAVCSHQAYPDLSGQRVGTCFRQIVYIGTGRIALVHDIQAEFFFLDRVSAQGIDILHHQIPILHGGRHIRASQ